MKTFISHLTKNEDLVELLNKYPVGIEIVNFASALSLDSKEKELDVLREALGGYLKRGISIHGPYVDMSPGSPDRKIREATRERFQECYDIALKEFHAERIVFHSGFIPKVSYDEEWLKYSKGFWKEFLQDKGEDNISIHIENVFDKDYNLLMELVDYVNKPNFSICFDIGHKNACSSLSIEEWIKNLGKRIGYVHLHNNDGRDDLHNPIAKGTMDIHEVLELLTIHAPSASRCIEVFSKEGIEASLELLKKSDYL